MLAFPCSEISSQNITRNGTWGCVENPSGQLPGSKKRFQAAHRRQNYKVQGCLVGLTFSHGMGID